MDVRNEYVRSLLQNKATYTTPLVLIALETYGAVCLEWAPETLHAELADDFRVKLPLLNQDRLDAGARLLTTDVFYRDLPEHIMLSNVLAGTPASFSTFDPSDLAEEAWAITEASLLSPPESGNQEIFDEDIRRYLGKLADDAGLLTLPDVLQMAIRSDSRAQVSRDYADDTTLFQAIIETELAKAEDIDRMIVQNVSEMFEQLAGLPISQIDKRIEKIRNRLGLTTGVPNG